MEPFQLNCAIIVVLLCVLNPLDSEAISTTVEATKGDDYVQLHCGSLPHNVSTLSWGRVDSGSPVNLVDIAFSENGSTPVFEKDNMDKYKIKDSTLLVADIRFSDSGVYLCNSSDLGYQVYVTLHVKVSETPSRSNLGVIIGCAVGGFVVLLVFILLLVICLRKCKRRNTHGVKFKLGNATKKQRHSRASTEESASEKTDQRYTALKNMSATKDNEDVTG